MNQNCLACASSIEQLIQAVVVGKTRFEGWHECWQAQDATGDAAGSAKSAAGDVSGSAKSASGDITSSAKSAAGDVKGAAQSAGRQVDQATPDLSGVFDDAVGKV